MKVYPSALDKAIMYYNTQLRQFEEHKKIRAVTHEDYEWAEKHRQLAEWLKELKELRKQKETIIDRLSEKFAYLNTCPNERDMIIRIVGGTSSNEIHCDTDCNHTDCKSYHFGFNVKKDKYE